MRSRSATSSSRTGLSWVIRRQWGALGVGVELFQLEVEQLAAGLGDGGLQLEMGAVDY